MTRERLALVLLYANALDPWRLGLLRASQREATRIVVGWPPPKSAQQRAAEWMRVPAPSQRPLTFSPFSPLPGRGGT